MRDYDSSSTISVFARFYKPRSLGNFSLNLKDHNLFRNVIIKVKMNSRWDIIIDILIVFLAVLLKDFMQSFFISNQMRIFYMVLKMKISRFKCLLLLITNLIFYFYRYYFLKLFYLLVWNILLYILFHLWIITYFLTLFEFLNHLYYEVFKYLLW